MVKKLRIGVIFGGRSGEHEVSVRSARSVIEAMDASKYEVVPIAITKSGNWLAPAVAARLLPKGTQRRLSARVLGQSKTDVAIIADPSRRGLALLELAALAFVGCGTVASACGMDKVIMKALFREAGLPICNYTWLLRSGFEREPEKALRRVTQE